MKLPITNVSRRNALLAGGGAVAAVGAFAASPLRNPVMGAVRELIVSVPQLQRFLSLADATYEEWAAQVGSTFALGGGTTMRLTGVRPYASPGDRPWDVARRRGFAAIFDLDGGQTMPADLIYTVAHPRYGPLQIFLSAGDPRTPGRLHAEFN